MVWMSQRAPGYRFQYQVPPTSPASSSSTVERPALRNRCRRYRPAKPAPTTATSACCVVPPLLDCQAEAATVASDMLCLPVVFILCQTIPAPLVCHQSSAIFGSCACGEFLFE